MPAFTGVRTQVAARIPEPLFYRLVSWLHYAGEAELRMLRSFVPADKVAVDVGSWYGPWAYWLSRVARRVETIEPVPEVAEFLRHVVPGNVHVFCVALSDHVGEGELFVPTGGRGSEGLSSLVPPPADGPERKRVKVPLCRLDDLGFEDVGFVKVDVEGHELEVLSGALKMLDGQHPTVLVEIEQRFHDQPIDEVFDVFTSRGYQGFFYAAHAWQPISEFDVDKHQLERLASLSGSGFIAHSLLGHRGYINNFLFSVNGKPARKSTIRPAAAGVSAGSLNGSRCQARGDSEKSVRVALGSVSRSSTRNVSASSFSKLSRR
jgi:FkbM family methyltransferase